MTGQAPNAPSLVDSLQEYLDGLPADGRADALHQVFYGFYTRVAIIDRTTHELAGWAREAVAGTEDLPAPLAEALRDNALFVGQELFASRLRAMSAMGYVAGRLAKVLDGAEPPAFTLHRAVAFDEASGGLRTYPLGVAGAHPDLPPDPLGYDPG